MSMLFNINLFDAVSTVGICIMLGFVIRSYRMWSDFYDRNVYILEEKARNKSTHNSERVEILQRELLEKNDYINKLTSILQQIDLRNGQFLNRYSEIGIKNLDHNQYKDLKKIIKQEDELRAIGCASIDTLKKLVKIHLALEDYEKAISLQKFIIGLDKHFEHYYSLAVTYHRLGMFNEAIACYEKMIKKDSNNAVGYNGLGMCYQMLGTKTGDENERKIFDYKAIQFYQQAIKLDSQYVFPKIGEAIILIRNNKLVHGVNKISEIKEIEKQFGLTAEDYYGMACLYSQIKYEKNALKYLDIALGKTEPTRREELLYVVKSDPDLQYVRRNGGFKELLYRY